ncbi:hypothetical protein Q6348_09795 [Isoptericola sp. b441]|uniref:UDP-N-acetylmuramyl pentapeptide phosphotransferase/UDP-N-acetylglucosamine-1-phosphate transferase n=1 Tax=Actinotalea lenta TaxID=3064654 RepID=A0ABT9DA97_9CELL|nr:hypothetical protein [Isoptericola sp. b441]MDO8107485.1 hypothetical protein [Isoptericola sp. b441]
MGRPRVAPAAVLACVASAGVRAGLEAAWGGTPRWTRTNHRGAPISLLEGPAVGLGVLAGTAALPAPWRGAAAIAGAGGLAFGLVDDLAEDSGRARKGLRGHLGALAHGELTTGGLKLLGIGAVSTVAAALAVGRPTGSRAVWLGDVLTGGALVAVTANLVNLLDLRPGRALKAVWLASLATLPGEGGPAGAVVLGAASAALPADLAERDMLGDGGANALGAVLGVAALAGTGRVGRVGLLAGAVGLTLASERISFSDVIARTSGLRELDAWGRRA